MPVDIQPRFTRFIDARAPANERLIGRHAVATVLLHSANDLQMPASRTPETAKLVSGAYEHALLRLRFGEVPSTAAVLPGECAVNSRRLSQGARNGLIGQQIPSAGVVEGRSIASGAGGLS
jgi:hypothetical protein